MPHAELVNIALGLHSSVLVAAILAYYKYGERTELIDRGLRAWDAVLTELHQRIATELVSFLESYMDSNLTVPTITVEHDPAYIERSTNHFRSEAFRETIRDFVEGNSSTIADFRTLAMSRIQWLNWARFLSWTLLILLVAEIVVVGTLGLVDKLAGLALPEKIIEWSWLPVAIMVSMAILPLPFMLHKHDILAKCKIKYELF